MSFFNGIHGDEWRTINKMTGIGCSADVRIVKFCFGDDIFKKGLDRVITLKKKMKIVIDLIDLIFGDV